MAMHFKVGEGTRNVLLNRGHKDAAYRQSDLEHEQTLNQYVRPGMTEFELLLAKDVTRLIKRDTIVNCCPFSI